MYHLFTPFIYSTYLGEQDVRDLVLHIIADAPPPSWIRVQVSLPSACLHFLHTPPFLEPAHHSKASRPVALLVPGLTSTVLSLPPLPTSSTENPNVPIPIFVPPNPLADPTLTCRTSWFHRFALRRGRSTTVASPSSHAPFSHAYPTRTLGDANRMYSILNTFFQAPVSGEEKKRRLQERIAGLSSFMTPCLPLHLIFPTAAERAGTKHPSQYLLPVEQMVENDYLVPSYLADVFKMPDGLIETPGAPTDTKSENHSVYAIDCEMARALRCPLSIVC
jgi:RNA exonuclease 1